MEAPDNSRNFAGTCSEHCSHKAGLGAGGKGGASGSASLEKLMDKLPFRAKPKIVDLTSERKLADRVRSTALLILPVCLSTLYLED